MTTGNAAARSRADRLLLGAGLLLLFSGSAPLGFNLYTNEFRMPPVAGQVHLTPMISPEQVLAQHEAQEHECLAQVLYYEARGEGEAGEKAVAEVVLERTHSRYYPNTICGVVREGADQPGRHCQFSFACDGSVDKPKDEAAWDRAQMLAQNILGGAVKLRGETGHAIAYHSADVSPDWADEMQMTAQIGNHIFYRRMPFNRSALAIPAAVEIPIKPTDVTLGDVPALGDIASDEIQPNVQIAGAEGDSP